MTLSKQTSIWRRMFFSGNVNKMRIAMMRYLTQEGLKNTFENGMISIEYEESFYGVSFEIMEGYPECILSFIMNDDYKALSESDKTYIADKVNTEEQNHVTVYTFNDSVKVLSCFYFTNKRMILDMFARHFHGLLSTVNNAMGLVLSAIDANKASSQKPMGFAGRSKQIDNEEVKIVAEKKQEVE